MAVQAYVVKHGPYGNESPTNWNFELGPCEAIREVIIRSGFIVDGIGFVVSDNWGETKTAYFGSQGGSSHKITLKSGEYITHISGTYGIYQGRRCNIATIKIHTNFCPYGYGPCGQGQDVRDVRDFSTTTQSGIAVVGFFGRDGGPRGYLESIGAYIKQGTLIPGQPNKCGPWGQHAQTNWNLELGPSKTVREVIIRSGFIVDAIGFVIADHSGETTTNHFGGQGGDYHRIELRSGECVTHISGTYGVYTIDNECHIATIKIHTNFCPRGYGPYGQGREVRSVCSFSTTFQPGVPIVGFFGRANNYLDSIGVYVKQEAKHDLCP